MATAAKATSVPPSVDDGPDADFYLVAPWANSVELACCRTAEGRILAQLGKAGEVHELLVKLDANGNHLWSKAFGPVAAPGGCVVAVSSADEPILACSVEAVEIDLGNGPLPAKGGLDVVIAKFAP